MSVKLKTMDAVSLDLEALGVVLLRAPSEEVVLLERVRAGVRGVGSRYHFMMNRPDCGAAFLVADVPGLTDGLLVIEMGHALAWVLDGRPPGHDWSRRVVGRLRGLEADPFAIRLGLSYAGYRGIPLDKRLVVSPGDEEYGLVREVLP